MIEEDVLGVDGRVLVAGVLWIELLGLGRDLWSMPNVMPGVPRAESLAVEDVEVAGLLALLVEPKPSSLAENRMVRCCAMVPSRQSSRKKAYCTTMGSLNINDLLVVSSGSDSTWSQVM